MRSYSAAHEQIETRRRLAGMDAQRIAANASAEDYRRFQESHAEPAVQRRQVDQDDAQIDRSLAAFGLVRQQ